MVNALLATLYPSWLYIRNNAVKLLSYTNNNTI